MALAQTQFRFGQNSGNEATHGWIAPQNQNIVYAPDTTFLLRFNIQNLDTEQASGPPFIVQLYRSLNAGVKTLVAVGQPVVIPVASVLTEDADCTQRLTGGTGAFLADNDGQTEAATAGSGTISLGAGACTEVECSLQIVSAGVAHGDTLDFYIYVNGVQVTATDTPRVVVSLATDTWLSVDSAVAGRADSPWFTASRN